MTERVCAYGRRHFIQVATVALVAAPLLNRKAEAAELMSESDPKAVAVKYKADATKSTERKDAKATCDNCNLFTAKPGESTGACVIFDGRLVTAKGWCTAWEGY